MAGGWGLGAKKMMRQQTQHSTSRSSLAVACAAVAILFLTAVGAQAPRPRARDLGVEPGVFPPGPLNAITDVAGVRVGHVTLVEGDRVRTGVTAVATAWRQPVPGQGSRRRVRRQRLRQAGRFDASRRTRHHRDARRPDQHLERGRSGRRNRRLDDRAARQRRRPFGERGGRRDQRRRPQRHPGPARDEGPRAGGHRGGSEGPVEEGSVGAGTGTQCFGWKGGHRHGLARRACRRVALHARRAGADQFRGRAHHRRRAGRQRLGRSRSDPRTLPAPVRMPPTAPA